MLLFKRLSISLFIGIILISCSSNQGDKEYRRLEKRAENVTIIRDNWVCLTYMEKGCRRGFRTDVRPV